MADNNEERTIINENEKEEIEGFFRGKDAEYIKNLPVERIKELFGRLEIVNPAFLESVVSRDQDLKKVWETIQKNERPEADQNRGPDLSQDSQSDRGASQTDKGDDIVLNGSSDEGKAEPAESKQASAELEPDFANMDEKQLMIESIKAQNRVAAAIEKQNELQRQRLELEQGKKPLKERIVETARKAGEYVDLKGIGKDMANFGKETYNDTKSSIKKIIKGAKTAKDIGVLVGAGAVVGTVFGGVVAYDEAKGYAGKQVDKVTNLYEKIKGTYRNIRTKYELWKESRQDRAVQDEIADSLSSRQGSKIAGYHRKSDTPGDRSGEELYKAASYPDLNGHDHYQAYIESPDGEGRHIDFWAKGIEKLNDDERKKLLQNYDYIADQVDLNGGLLGELKVEEGPDGKRKVTTVVDKEVRDQLREMNPERVERQQKFFKNVEKKQPNIRNYVNNIEKNVASRE